MKTKKDSRTAEEKRKALKAALQKAGLDTWSPGSPTPDPASDPGEPAGGSKPDRPPDGGDT